MVYVSPRSEADTPRGDTPPRREGPETTRLRPIMLTAIAAKATAGAIIAGVLILWKLATTK
jgi:hypothetical protein